MRDKEPIAHVREDGQVHSLRERLEEVADKAATFAEHFASSDWAWNAGLLHDLGKADTSFQAYIHRENGMDDSEYDSAGKNRVNHSSAGAAFAEDHFNRTDLPIGRVIAYLAAGHHAGLPDWYPTDTGNAALQVRLDEGNANSALIRAVADGLVAELCPDIKPPFFVRSENFHLWLRILYSCLVDADFLDTEDFMKPEQGQSRPAWARGLTSPRDGDIFRLESAAWRAVSSVLATLKVSAVVSGPGLFLNAVISQADMFSQNKVIEAV